MVYLVNPFTLPFLFFWVIVLLHRDELGFRGFVFWVCLWAGLLVACALLRLSPYVFLGIQAVIDIVLLLIFVGRDIRIR